MIKKNYPVKLTAVTASLLTLLCPLSAFAESNETTETTELIVGDTVILEQSFDDREIKKWSP